MRAAPVIVMVLVVMPILFPGAISAAESVTAAVGHGSSLPVLNRGNGPCGYLFMNSDGVYENGYAFDSEGIQPPYYGAMAEYYSGLSREVCGLVFDLTTLEGAENGQTFDAVIWDDDNGNPGLVRRVVAGIDPAPVAYWPQVSEYVVTLDPPSYMNGAWWVGHWGDWPGQRWGWFVAADLEGDGPPGGRPMANIAPGIGYPTGWQSVSVVWGPTRAIGIGLYGRTSIQSSSVPLDPGRPTGSWGRIKSLYK